MNGSQTSELLKIARKSPKRLVIMDEPDGNRDNRHVDKTENCDKPIRQANSFRQSNLPIAYVQPTLYRNGQTETAAPGRQASVFYVDTPHYDMGNLSENVYEQIDDVRSDISLWSEELRNTEPTGKIEAPEDEEPVYQSRSEWHLPNSDLCDEGSPSDKISPSDRKSRSSSNLMTAPPPAPPPSNLSQKTTQSRHLSQKTPAPPLKPARQIPKEIPYFQIKPLRPARPSKKEPSRPVLPPKTTNPDPTAKPRNSLERQDNIESGDTIVDSGDDDDNDNDDNDDDDDDDDGDDDDDDHVNDDDDDNDEDDDNDLYNDDDFHGDDEDANAPTSIVHVFIVLVLVFDAHR